MKFHNHRRILVTRFIFIFLFAFIGVFVILNVRFVIANTRYWLAPGTIRSPESLTHALSLFPLSANADAEPLPSKAELVVDSIGIRAPIVFNVAPNNDSIYKSLENGVVHYSAGPKPGLPGTAVILGHSSAYPWYKGAYGSVFALLSKLKPGETFYIQYEDGRIFVFRIKQAIVFNPFGDTREIDKLDQSEKPTLLLISCWPVGTNYRRIAVQAELVTK